MWVVVCERVASYFQVRGQCGALATLSHIAANFNKASQLPVLTHPAQSTPLAFHVSTLDCFWQETLIWICINSDLMHELRVTSVCSRCRVCYLSLDFPISHQQIWTIRSFHEDDMFATSHSKLQSICFGSVLCLKRLFHTLIGLAGN